MDFDALLRELKRCTQELQGRCANQGGVIVVDASDTAALSLCVQIDRLLEHGLLRKYANKDYSYWPLIKHYAHKGVIEELKGLWAIKTRKGRCRAWIRLALNQRLLESYLNNFVSDPSVLSKIYEKHAYIRRSEEMDLVTMLLSGLEQMHFVLPLNVAEYDPIRGAGVQLNAAAPAAAPRQQQQQHPHEQQSRAEGGASDRPSGVEVMNDASAPTHRVMLEQGGVVSVMKHTTKMKAKTKTHANLKTKTKAKKKGQRKGKAAERTASSSEPAEEGEEDQGREQGSQEEEAGSMLGSSPQDEAQAQTGVAGPQRHESETTTEDATEQTADRAKADATQPLPSTVDQTNDHHQQQQQQQQQYQTSEMRGGDTGPHPRPPTTPTQTEAAAPAKGEPFQGDEEAVTAPAARKTEPAPTAAEETSHSVATLLKKREGALMPRDRDLSDEAGNGTTTSDRTQAHAGANAGAKDKRSDSDALPADGVGSGASGEAAAPQSKHDVDEKRTGSTTEKDEEAAGEEAEEEDERENEQERRKTATNGGGEKEPFLERMMRKESTPLQTAGGIFADLPQHGAFEEGAGDSMGEATRYRGAVDNEIKLEVGEEADGEKEEEEEERLAEDRKQGAMEDKDNDKRQQQPGQPEQEQTREADSDEHGTHEGAQAHYRGSGVELDVSPSSDLLLLARMNILRSDDEELLRLVHVTLIESYCEIPALLILSTTTVYVVVKTPKGSWETLVDFPTASLTVFGVVMQGQGFLLHYKRQNVSKSLRHLSLFTGDEDVTESVKNEFELQLSDLVVQTADPHRKSAVHSLFDELDTVGELLCYHVCYVAVTERDLHAAAAREVSHHGVLQCKREGFLSTSWKPFDAQLRRETLQLVSKDDKQQRLSVSTRMPGFRCRSVKDEMPHCFEIGAPDNDPIVLCANDRMDKLAWMCNISSPRLPIIRADPITEPAPVCGGSDGKRRFGSWMLSSVLLSPDHLHICRENHSRHTFRHLGVVDVEHLACIELSEAEASPLSSSPSAPPSTTMVGASHAKGVRVCIVFDDEDEGEEDEKPRQQGALAMESGRMHLLFKTLNAALCFQTALSTAYQRLYQIPLPCHRI